MLEKSSGSRGKAYVLLLKACTTSKNLRRGSEIHAELCKNGLLNCNQYIGSALINMYAKCGAINKAVDVLLKLPTRYVAAWNALIGGYAYHDYDEEALQCYEKMLIDGVAADAFTFSLVLKACGAIQDAEKGRYLHSEIARHGFFEGNIIVGTSLVDMYAKCGILSKAKEVFSLVKEKNVLTWTALISGYEQHKLYEEALQAFMQMQSEGIFANGITFACILKACRSIGAIEIGYEVHSEIVRKGLLKTDTCLGNLLIYMYASNGMLTLAHEVFESLPKRTIATWTSLLSGYVQHGREWEVLNSFTRMQCECIHVDGAAFACVLKACGNIGVFEKGLEIHTEIARRGLLRTDLSVGSALVSVYAKSGAVALAQEVFDALLDRNAFTWNSLIAGYALRGDFEGLIGSCEAMQGCGMLNPITFIIILNACNHEGLVDKGQACFEWMLEEYGIVPTGEHHACIIDLFGRAGQSEKAMFILANRLSLSFTEEGQYPGYFGP